MSRYFKPDEFKSVHCSISDMDKDFLSLLDELRESFNSPLYLTSAYRSVSHELKRGRSGSSFHCLGRAVDVVKPDNGVALHRLVSKALSLQLSVGIGPTFVHFDNRPRPILFTYYK